MIFLKFTDFYLKDRFFTLRTVYFSKNIFFNLFQLITSIFTFDSFSLIFPNIHITTKINCLVTFDQANGHFHAPNFCICCSTCSASSPLNETFASLPRSAGTNKKKVYNKNECQKKKVWPAAFN